MRLGADRAAVNKTGQPVDGVACEAIRPLLSTAVPDPPEITWVQAGYGVAFVWFKYRGSYSVSPATATAALPDGVLSFHAHAFRAGAVRQGAARGTAAVVTAHGRGSPLQVRGLEHGALYRFAASASNWAGCSAVAVGVGCPAEACPGPGALLGRRIRLLPTHAPAAAAAASAAEQEPDAEREFDVESFHGRGGGLVGRSLLALSSSLSPAMLSVAAALGTPASGGGGGGGGGGGMAEAMAAAAGGVFSCRSVATGLAARLSLDDGRGRAGAAGTAAGGGRRFAVLGDAGADGFLDADARRWLRQLLCVHGLAAGGGRQEMEQRLRAGLGWRQAELSVQLRAQAQLEAARGGGGAGSADAGEGLSEGCQGGAARGAAETDAPAAGAARAAHGAASAAPAAAPLPQQPPGAVPEPEPAQAQLPKEAVLAQLCREQGLSGAGGAAALHERLREGLRWNRLQLQAEAARVETGMGTGGCAARGGGGGALGGAGL